MPAPTSLLPFDGSRIPEALKRVPRWAPWRASWNDKRKKWDKVPHRADNPGYGLSTVRPEQWFKYDAAVGAMQRVPGKFAGVGYCMTKPHGTIGIDLDHCIVDGIVEPWALAVVERVASYTEISPSGTGLRIVGMGAVPQDWNNHEVGIEVYGGNEARFLTITGQHLAGMPMDLAAIDEAVLADLARQYAKERRKAEVIDLNMPDMLDELLLPDLASINLPDRSRAFLERGEFDGDRSGALHGAGVSLYAAGLSDDVVFSILAANEYAMGVALDHRRQDTDRALLYLWREHCMKAKAKGQAAIVTADEFDVVETPAGSAPELPAFKRDGKGKIEASIENVAMAVRRPDVCGMEIRFDQFRDEIMFATPGRQDWRPFRDADYARLRITLERGNFKPIGRELIRDVVLLVADESPFDSAIMWLDGLKWDGVPRVENFMRDYFGAADSAYNKAVSNYLWTALAGRVMVPGIKADMVPILVGKQGVTKSSSVSSLVPSHEFFTEISFNEPDDNLARKMRGRLVAEIGELRGLHTRELESIKAFITRQYENWVPKYREFAVQFPRRLIFIGTTNKDEFLADETGNRRWLPVLTPAANVDAVRRDRDQLWAEGRELFGIFGVMYQDAESLAEPAHKAHTITDPWAEDVARWLDEPDALTGEKPRNREFLRTSDILREALRIESRAISRKEEMRAADALRNCGFLHVKKRINGVPLWIWVECSNPVPS